MKRSISSEEIDTNDEINQKKKITQVDVLLMSDEYNLKSIVTDISQFNSYNELILKIKNILRDEYISNCDDNTFQKILARLIVVSINDNTDS